MADRPLSISQVVTLLAIKHKHYEHIHGRSLNVLQREGFIGMLTYTPDRTAYSNIDLSPYGEHVVRVALAPIIIEMASWINPPTD